MGYLDNTYAQNWVEQLRVNHKRLHPERDMRERMEQVGRNGVDVFCWYDTREGNAKWSGRYMHLLPIMFKLIR